MDATPAPEASGTSPPKPTTTPTASATEKPQPIILTFQADTEWANPGDTVVLTWQTVGAGSAMLYKMMPSGQLPADGIPLPPSGSRAYRIPESDQNWASFLLYVWDDADNHTMATAEVRLHCSHAWFFDPPEEDICPTEPLPSKAAEQRFEHGTMVWVEREDAIYVLYSDPVYTTRWARVEDRWEEGMPVQDPELQPPEGLQQPRRGFGLVWRAHPQVREQLGWAVDSETGYATVIQRTTRYKYNAWYLLALDGTVWHLGPEGGSWSAITPDAISVSPP